MTRIAKAKTTMLVLGAALLLQAMPVQAGFCAHTDAFVDILWDNQRQSIAFSALVGHPPERALSLYLNKEDRTWTLVEKAPSYIGCIIATGHTLVFANEMGLEFKGPREGRTRP